MASGRSLRRRAPLAGLVGGLVALVATTAAAAPAVADFTVFVGAGMTSTTVQNAPSGGSVRVTALSFKVTLTVDNDGGEEATARARFTLPEGLRFGQDAPDATEGCGLADRVAECSTGVTVGTDPSRRTNVWFWDAVAASPGSYPIGAEILSATVSDPNAANNATSVTVVVSAAPGGGAGGGGTATVSASAARLAPAKPKAGGVVTATVRVTANGAAARPTRVTCSGAIGSAKVTGSGRAASGAAACTYRTPRSATGKTLRGSVAFNAGGQRFTRRFSAKLG